MPYTKNPVTQTYDTKRINLIYNPQQRDSNPAKDYRLVNMMTEVVPSPLGEQHKLYLKSRAGLTQTYTTQTGEGRGIYYWLYGGAGHCMSVSGNKVYADGVEVLTLATSTGKVGMTEFVASTGVVTLILLDGTNGYVFSSPTTYTQIVSPDFPTPHIPTPIFLDAYVFVAKADSEDIYNSDLDNPLSWTAGSYISAEMYPDKIVSLSKNNNFLYAVGTSSVEYFYDVGNAIGSPLARQPSAVQQFGTASIGSVVQTEKQVIFVGETNDGGHTVWTIDGFQEKEIGIPAVKSALLAEDGNVANSTAFGIRVSGQKLYVLCLSQRTFVYSFNTQMWSEWQTGTFIFTGNYATDGPNGSAYVLDKSTGQVYTMNDNLFTDNGVAINCSVVTTKQDFDDINRKFMHRFSLIGDVPDDTLVESSVAVQWSDDDYKTWSPARVLRFNADLPAIHQLGQFRRRAFKISYSLPHLFRISGFEVDLNKGSA